MSDYTTQELEFYATIASDSYDRTVSVGDIFSYSGTSDHTLIQVEFDDVSSFGGQAYYSSSDNRLVISYTGTENQIDGQTNLVDLLLTDLSPGGSVAIGGHYTNQYASAFDRAAESLPTRFGWEDLGCFV
ncbi:MAG: hypothetical protein AAGJ34_00555 [Pseudomonadota bacterium]